MGMTVRGPAASTIALGVDLAVNVRRGSPREQVPKAYRNIVTEVPHIRASTDL